MSYILVINQISSNDQIISTLKNLHHDSYNKFHLTVTCVIMTRQTLHMFDTYSFK